MEAMMLTSETMATQSKTAARKGTVPRDPEELWAAVLSRDGRLEGEFVYGVKSTGVFCRPTCPSRRPRREQAAFFSGPAEASAAGFRACRRCHPEAPRAPVAVVVERVREHIDAHLDERLTLGTLARVAGLSPAHLQRTFKAGLGLSPRDYLRARRAERFKSEVRRGRSVTDALYEAGYGSGSRLYEDADAQLGMTPGAYRQGGRGQLLNYGIAASPFGRLLVAQTERGVSAVQIADSDRALEAGLRKDYPHAELRRDDAALRSTVAAILAHLGGLIPKLDLPLDVAATAFQWRVWRALQDIPRGETRSYAEVAKAVGQPKAVRAVARACATNRVALLVPCHRVVRSDGSRGGYRWGAKRKSRILEDEKLHLGRGPR